jgi:hypothetical protein
LARSRSIALELPGLGRVDERRGQVAEAGRDPVHDRTLRDQRLDDVARLLHPLAGVDVDLDRGAVAGDGLHLRDGQIGPGEDHRSGIVCAPRERVRVAVRDLRLGHGFEDSRLSSGPCSTS